VEGTGTNNPGLWFWLPGQSRKDYPINIDVDEDGNVDLDALEQRIMEDASDDDDA
jgi:hypothetical protein